MKRDYKIALMAIFIVAALSIGIYLLLHGVKEPPAVVNGEPISAEELDKALEARARIHTGTGAQVDQAMLRSAVLEQLISEKLILQGAREAGIKVTDDEVEAELKAVKQRSGEDAFAKYLAESGYSEAEYKERLKERMLKDRFVSEVINTSEITEDELKDFYKNSPMPLLKPESVEVRIIEFATQEAAEGALKDMKKPGSGFDAVADRLKDDQNTFVSEYGETSPSYYKGEIAKAMKELKAGTFGGPYSGRDGFFLVRIKSRTPERPKTFKEAREEIKSILSERRSMAAITHWVAEKRNSSVIERN